MRKFFGNIYITNRFFFLFGIIALLFVISFTLGLLFPIAQALIVVAMALVLAEVFMLFNPSVNVTANRVTTKVLSLGSDNHVKIYVQNKFGLKLDLNVVDEMPSQLQKRDFNFNITLLPGEEQIINYVLHPTLRGEYQFGKINIYAKTALGFIERRFPVAAETMVPVYPSIIQMKEFELKTMARIAHFHGVKKLRRIGHSYEFEQIKNYVRGDDMRTINWKATGRQAEIMVNQYEEERSQQVYNVIDNSRNMRMPFNGLSLLDHAINTSLIISNTALQKQDRTGLITFSDKQGSMLKADSSMSHLRKILDGLYHVQDRNFEANYEMLYHSIRNFVKGRSLLFLYTNFESFYSLERVLPILRKINMQHLLVVIFFENTEISDYTTNDCKNVEDIYHQTVAQKFVHEKYQIIQGLRQFGIQIILSRPEDLSINTINKYLELKARGLI
jgi:uncharacterized protein (DUF58 family)